MAGPRLRVQSVIYHQTPDTVRRLVLTLAHAASRALSGGGYARVSVLVGDCSIGPVLDDGTVSRLSDHLDEAGVQDFQYVPFGENLGHGGGHNRLLADGFDEDLVLFVNPDAVLAPNTLQEFLHPFAKGRTGVVEARQIPFEHPKEWDPVTGGTPWCSFACAMVRGTLARELGGFDESFFLHCDDVDFSWRARLAGYTCVHHPAARVFHDRRPGDDGQISPSPGEELHGASGLMLLAWKYHHDDVVERLRDVFGRGSVPQREAVADFDRRLAAGPMPERLDPDHRVSRFVGYDVASSRF